MSDAIHQTSYAIFVNPEADKPFGLAVTMKVENSAIQCSVGVECLNAAGQSLGYRWCIAKNSTAFSTTFQEYKGWLFGVGSGDSQFAPNTRFIKPTVRIDENDTGYAVWLDNWRVREIANLDDDVIDGNSYGRVKASEIDNGRIKQLWDGSGTLTAININTRTTRVPGLVPNGDFALKNDDNTPIDWTVDSGVVVASTYSGSGNQSLKIPPGCEAYTTPYISVAPAKFYVIRCQVRTDGSANAGSRIGVICYDGGKTELGRRYCVLADSVNFQQWRTCFMLMQGEGDADSHVTYFLTNTRYVRFVARNAADLEGGDLWIDNVEIDLASPELLEQFGDGSDGVFSSSGNNQLRALKFNYREFKVNSGHTVKLLAGAQLRVWGDVIINGTLTY